MWSGRKAAAGGIMKKTKIICTMGPRTMDKIILKELIAGGMNVARFNFSHGSYEEHAERIALVRQVSEQLGIPVALMLDTKGPEIRTGLLKDGKKVSLEQGKMKQDVPSPISSLSTM